MRQPLKEDHRIDDNGNPAGGFTTGWGIDIKWQDGPIARDADGEPTEIQNGAMVEDVIAAIIGRLEFFETAAGGKYSCPQNKGALLYLQRALDEQDDRTAERVRRGVEGTHQP